MKELVLDIKAQRNIRRILESPWISPKTGKNPATA